MLGRRPNAELRIPIRDADDEERGRRRAKRKSKCCNNNCETQSALLSVMVFALLGILVLFVVIVVSLYGPAGRMNQTLNTAEDMIFKVNNSGITNVIFDIATNWQSSNMTTGSLALISGAIRSSDIVFGLIASIEPELVRELANRTAITASGFLELVDGIIKNQHLDITIPLGLGT